MTIDAAAATTARRKSLSMEIRSSEIVSPEELLSLTLTELLWKTKCGQALGKLNCQSNNLHDKLRVAEPELRSRTLLQGDISPPGMWPDDDDDESLLSESTYIAAETQTPWQ